ncbi:hypothetical protein HPP92_024365 [Vanilla planifolia]|uniref:High affinity nitrate transporter 2.5 n=1 Tax=Vanilla planifolia TaxID=51239 RepID=A0A835UCI5_VANPL|nr:hypothetical protein HPP92_024365 [Vanilla planifolia]
MEEEGKRSDEPKFAVAVDSEHKATELRLLSFAAPHMRCFHLSWFSFFTCFCSTFAAPPLLPVIRDNLNLTDTDIGNAGIAAVSGAVIARLSMGTACDLIGPRLASASLSLLTSPAVFLTSIVSSPVGFVLARFFTGFSIASFVSNQFWMSSMFSAARVGGANGLAAGWGNLGGGAIQLLMPLFFSLIHRVGSASFTAWRIAFFIPALSQVLSAIAVLSLGQDLPDGDFWRLKQAGEKRDDGFGRVLCNALTNYRGWILALIYGFCFGVELVVDNVIAEYYYDRFDVNLHTAGMVAASFGLANFVSRPGGGWLSDRLAAKFGMRGRLWGLWVVQTIGGVLCIVLGRMGRLASAVLVMILFSFFVQAACGLTFGIVPFVSRRSLGVVSGMTGGGGNMGAAVLQLIFFKGSRFSKETGISLMGIAMVGCALCVAVLYFPQWGGMLCKPRKGFTEEDYYMAEWNKREKEEGRHEASLKFAENSKNERGKTSICFAAEGPASSPQA